MKIGFIIFIIVLVVTFGDATLSKSDKKKKKEKKVSGPTETGVHERSLIRESVTYKSILKEYSAYSSLLQGVKSFTGVTLAYVTPWNGRGYDIAKQFGTKFSSVSPVWLQIRRRPNGEFYMTGDHDIDKGWVTDVKKNGDVKIVPRVLFDGWTSADFISIFTNEYVLNSCTNAITSFIKSHGFDGAVVEVWSSLGGQRSSDLIHVLNHLGDDLHAAGLSFILVVPPPVYSGNHPGFFNRDNFEALLPHVDYFSLMTYDYSNPSRPGPNSPIGWVRTCVLMLVPDDNKEKRSKILLGLNFYGNEYAAGEAKALLGSQFVEILEKYKPSIEWDATTMEHVTHYIYGAGNHEIFYPSLLSIEKRISMAKELGTGLSIWEIGQGLDYFYDLL